MHFPIGGATDRAEVCALEVIKAGKHHWYPQPLRLLSKFIYPVLFSLYSWISKQDTVYSINRITAYLD